MTMTKFTIKRLLYVMPRLPRVMLSNCFILDRNVVTILILKMLID